MYSSAFFNSKDGDRRYRAEIFAEYFASFIGNGVFPNPSTGLQVISGSGLDIIVKPGRAWINGYFFSNKAEHHIKLDASSGTYNRIDRIVLRWSLLDRVITFGVKKGSNYSGTAQPQAIQRDDDIFELVLGDVSVKKAAVSLSQADITDQRPNTPLCGIVVGTVKEIDTSTLFNQMQEWFAKFQDDAVFDLARWRTSSEEEFDEWFASIKDVLGEDVAGNLLNKIKAAEQSVTDLTVVVDGIADKARLSNSIWRETSSSTTARKVLIDGVESLDDIQDIPIYIQAGLYGTTAVSTLKINDLDAVSLYFPGVSSSTLTVTPPAYFWVRTGGVYCVVWDGACLQVINPGVRGATTSYAGVVQLSSSYTSTSSTMAPTLTALYNVYTYAQTATIAAGRIVNIARIDDKIAIGQGASVTSTIEAGIAIGQEAKVTRHNGAAYGRYASVTHEKGAALGYQTIVAAESGVAVGASSQVLAAGAHTVCVGINTRGKAAYGGAIGGGASCAHEHGYCFGYFSTTTAARQIMLGLSGYTPYAYAGLSVVSDSRDKTDISALGFDALEFINKIKPVQYRVDERSNYYQLVEVSNLTDEAGNSPDTVTLPVSALADEVRYFDLPEVFSAYEPVLCSDVCCSKDEAISHYRRKHKNQKASVPEVVSTDETITFQKVQRKRTGKCAGKRYHTGFLAQQIKEAADEVGFDFAGYKDHKVIGGDDQLSLTYEEFISPMVAAIQTLTRQNEELAAQNKDLTARLERLEKAVGI